MGGSDSNLLPPPSFEESQRPHSYHGLSPPLSASGSGTSTPGEPDDRWFWEKLKDTAIGTREERIAEWHRRQEEASRYATSQLRSESDTLHRIAFVWKSSDSVPSSSPFSTHAAEDEVAAFHCLVSLVGWRWAEQSIVEEFSVVGEESSVVGEVLVVGEASGVAFEKEDISP